MSLTSNVYPRGMFVDPIQLAARPDFHRSST
jgi:hypothetical protein